MNHHTVDRADPHCRLGERLLIQFTGNITVEEARQQLDRMFGAEKAAASRMVLGCRRPDTSTDYSRHGAWKWRPGEGCRFYIKVGWRPKR